MIRPNGSWTFYEYDDDGRKTAVYAPFKNSPIPLDADDVPQAPDPATCAVTTYDYSPVDPSDDQYEYGTYNETPDPANCSFTPGAGQAVRTTVVNGTVASPDGVANKTTKTTSIVDVVGNEVMNETHAYTGSGYERIDWTVRTYDDRGRVVAEYRSAAAMAERLTPAGSRGLWGCVAYDDFTPRTGGTAEGGGNPRVRSGRVESHTSGGPRSGPGFPARSPKGPTAGSGDARAANNTDRSANGGIEMTPRLRGNEAGGSPATGSKANAMTAALAGHVLVPR